MTPVFENNYKPKEAIDWEEIESFQNKTNKQFMIINFMFSIFDTVNFIVQNLLLSEWKKLIKDMLTTREKYAIIRKFSTSEKRDWSTFLMLKSQLENTIAEGFKNEFQSDFCRLDLAMFNSDIDIAFSTLNSLVKESNKRNSLKEFNHLSNN